MARSSSEIAHAFEALTESAAGTEVVSALCDGVRACPKPDECFEAMFRLMERYPEADWGWPGPLVHTMEEFAPTYEDALRASLRRHPTELAVWMVNRVLNSLRPGQRYDQWVQELRSVDSHPEATESIRAQATDHLAFQRDRLSA